MKAKSLFRRKDISKGGHGDEVTDYGLKRVLGVKDLTLFGIAAIIGAGIFSTVLSDEPLLTEGLQYPSYLCLWPWLVYSQPFVMLSLPR